MTAIMYPVLDGIRLRDLTEVVCRSRMDRVSSKTVRLQNYFPMIASRLVAPARTDESASSL
jgi:hypothetical protein